MFGMLPQAQVDRIFREGLVLTDDVRWQPQPSNPNWVHFESFLDSPRDAGLRLNMAISLIRAEKYRIIVRRGEQTLRRLDIRGSHRNPPGSDGLVWTWKTHKHQWDDRFGDKVAYTPIDISAADPFADSEYERTFREFCAECSIEFEGAWNDPPKHTQARLDI